MKREGHHGFDGVRHQPWVEIERGLRQGLLDQGATRQRRIAERQRIGRQSRKRNSSTVRERMIGAIGAHSACSAAVTIAACSSRRRDDA